VAKKRKPDTFISRLFTRHEKLRRVEGRRAREMARVMKDVKKQALGLIERNMTTFREAGEYIDSAAAVARANQTVAGIDALMAQRADWASSEVLSMRKEAWTQGVADIEFAAGRLPGDVRASMQGSFGQAFPEAAFSAVEHPVLGVAPDAMFNGVRAGTTQNMRNVLVNAVMSGESVQETGRRLSDAMDISVAAGERIARTNVNAMYNEAQKSVYDANADVLAGYAWEATLDDRTSQVCFMLHGQFWPLGSKTPGPPAHWNCRSILVPVFKDPAVQSLLDETPRRARQYTKTGKARPILVKGTTTPEQWARRQPSDVTLRMTGSQLKNSLFRRKLIGFDDLVDPSLRVRTDQEIIRRVAGLHPGNKALAKTARAMGVKAIPSPASIRKADAALAKKQPWDKPKAAPVTEAPAAKPTPIKSYADRGSSAVYKKEYRRWKQGLSSDETGAFSRWADDDNDFVRRVRLREIGVVKGKDVRGSMNTLHAAWNRAPSRGGIVYRGMDLREAEIRELLSSKTFTLKSTSSASRLKSVARGFTSPPTGGRGRVVVEFKTRSSIDFSGVDPWGGREQEQLIRMRTQFRITGTERRGEFIYLFAEEV